MASFAKGLAKDIAKDVGTDLAKDASKAAAKEAYDFATDDTRKVVVKLSNQTKQTWNNPRIFLNCGATDSVLPLTVDHGEEIEYKVHKKKWSLHGVAGVISFEWQESGQSYYLGVMFRKPTASRKNNWNAVIDTSKAEVNQRLFAALKNKTGEHPPLRNDSNYTNREFGPYTVQGAMATTATSVFIKVSCTSDL